jgi:hypothetical protein
MFALRPRGKNKGWRREKKNALIAKSIPGWMISRFDLFEYD